MVQIPIQTRPAICSMRGRVHRESFLIALLTLIALCNARPGLAQTLNEKLALEDPLKLVQESSEKGDIVRGAILFHQGNINCANCHRPIAEKDRIGPDLSRLPKETTDISIVESILQPSKTIDETYQTSVILTIDGKLVTGLVSSEDDQKVVLRTGQFSDHLVTIAVHDIEERRLGTKSSMPDGLVNELKNRQQFLDLLRYVLDRRRKGPIVAVETNSSTRRELADELKGLVLIDQLNCTACHESTVLESTLTPFQAPNLRWSALRLNPEYLTEFIADPQKTKPGTSMPHMLGHLDEAAQKAAAESMMQFLVSLDGNQYMASVDSSPDRDAIIRGNDLFHTVGCVACHSPRNDKAVEQTLEDSIPLGDLSKKYNLEFLTEFLEDPHVARPSGRMPNMVLSHREAMDLSSFLLQPNENSTTQSKAMWKVDMALARRGKQLFAELGCNKCHTDVIETDSGSSRFTTEIALDQLDVDDGCLSGADGDWPAFELSQNEQRQIRAAFGSSIKEHTQLTASRRIDVTMTLFNCTACHSRDNLGGVAENRRQYFQTTNLNLGEQGRIPPVLTGVGAKLNTKWMRDVLVNQRSIRPYMKTRMPQYGEHNIGHLIELFNLTDHLSETEFATTEDPEQARKLGLEIVGNGGLNCVACHTYQYKLSDTMPAVDLTEMSDRLKKDWFYQYMLAPQKFSPNTVMPSYWPNGNAIRTDIDGDPKFQVEAIWQYLLDGRQARVPRGVIREPLEIVVGDEARMLRRSYEGIGKRGIGVGYPGGVNQAFDAEQLRLAMIWRGKFVDPAGVWYGQGHGRVRPLGRTIIFPKGPELDDLVNPWIVDEGRPPNRQFKGYDLDNVRRPTFRYSFESIEVEDHLEETPIATSGVVQLQRNVRMTSDKPRDQLRFRIAADVEIVETSDQRYRVGKRLAISVVSDHVAKIVPDGEGKSLQVPLTFDAGQTHELVIEYHWE